MKKRAVIATGTFVSALVLAGCQQDAKAPEPVRPVLSMVLEPSRTDGTVAVGIVEPQYKTNLAFRVLGRLTGRPVSVGDLVSKGQTVGVIDSTALELAVRSAKAELAKAAKDAGKLQKNFEIPAAHRENFPERIARALKPAREAGLLPSFPFGSDFTDVEQRLIPALQLLQAVQRTPLQLPGLLWQGFLHRPDAADQECLARLGLDRPATLTERAYRALISAALTRSK